MQRVKLWIFIFLFFSSIVWAQDQLPNPIQPCTASGVTCTFLANGTNGDVLIIGANSEGTMTAPTLSLASTAITLIDSETIDTPFSYVWITTLSATGTLTITLHGTLSFPNINASEWPASIGTTIDGIPAHGGYSGTPATVALTPLTTTKNGDLLFGFISGFSSSGYFSVQPPALDLATGTASDSNGAGYKFTGVNGSYGMTFNNFINSKGSFIIFALSPSAITIDTNSIPTGAIGTTYGSYTLQARGGVGVYTWSRIGGGFPGGISLSSSGVISGTPTSGSGIATVQVTDGTNTTTKSLTLTVNSITNTIGFIQSVASNSGSIPMGTVPSGHLILVSQSEDNFSGNVVWSIPTDTQNTVYKYINTRIINRLGYLTTYGGIVPTTGVVTITGSLNSGQNLTAAEFSNAQAFFDIQGSILGTNVGAATLTGPTITTAVLNSEVWETITGAGLTTDATWSAGTGYILETLGNFGGPAINAEHANQSTIGSYTPTFNQLTSTSDGGWIIQGLGLRPTTSGLVVKVLRHGIIF